MPPPTLPTQVIAVLGRPNDWGEAKGAVALVNACWRTLGTAVVAQIARETGGSYFLDNICPTLLKRDALTGLRAARCREVTSQPAAR